MKIWLVTSYLLAVLVSIASLSGIFNLKTYSLETANWALQAVGQDIGNLLSVVALIVSTFYLNKGSAKAFLIWTGTLLYFIYAFLIYAFFIHFNFLFLIYTAILGLSAYTLVLGLLNYDISKFLNKLDKKSFKAAGITLLGIGLVFGLLWLSEIIPALFSGKLPSSVETAGLWVNPIHVIDLSLVLPGMILTGILLLRKKLMGYLFAVPWLTFSVLMGCCIVATLLMEFMQGKSEVLIPMVMVSAIVVASFWGAYSIIKKL